jgi:membrane associated rhomboid family serine protease
MNESDNINSAGRMGDPVVSIGRSLRNQVIILGGFIVVIWFLEIIDRLILGGSMDALGIRPRTLVGLRGIILMPLLHGGFGHLLANTLPFIVLGWLVMLNGMSSFFFISAVIIVVSGVGVWLFGAANSVHVGASGLVFGFFGFLVTRAYFERSLGSIILAFVVIIFYGGLLMGILPLTLGVSWQAHLFGFAGGVLAAYVISKRNRAAPS